jgi:hypothetical protein
MKALKWGIRDKNVIIHRTVSGSILTVPSPIRPFENVGALASGLLANKREPLNRQCCSTNVVATASANRLISTWTSRNQRNNNRPIVEHFTVRTDLPRVAKFDRPRKAGRIEGRVTDAESDLQIA